MSHAELESISEGLPSHREELMDSHPSQPTPAAHVAAGATAPLGHRGRA
jgi:hypothetical protein